MEKKKRAVALDNEIELGAVAEAQVAQAEGLIEIVKAIQEHQQAFHRAIIIAAVAGTVSATATIILFMWWLAGNL